MDDDVALDAVPQLDDDDSSDNNNINNTINNMTRSSLSSASAPCSNESSCSNAAHMDNYNEDDNDADDDDSTERGPTIWHHIKTGVKEIINAATTPFRGYQLGSRSPIINSTSQCHLLGKAYSSAADPLFVEDFKSRLWMTYRNAYPPIKPSAYTSDVGWGCMLRSGQMILANALSLHSLGRDWRLPHSSRGATSKSELERYVQIISWFLDSNTSPYSIHRIALLGRQFDKDIGEWFGPSTIAQVLKILNASNIDASMSIYVATDGIVILNDIRQACVQLDDDGRRRRCSVLVLVPVRLGVDSLNPVYFESIKKSFAIPHSVGIAGGRPNSSLYFVGHEGDHLAYLDPHYMRATIEPKDASSYTMEDLESYHCPTVRLVPVNTIDPSMVFGFYCKDEQEVDAFKLSTQQLCDGRTPLFSIQEQPPNYREAEILSDTDSF